MRAACWINKATDTHSEYVIFIASPPQKQLREGTSVLRHSALPLSFPLYAVYALNP